MTSDNKTPTIGLSGENRGVEGGRRLILGSGSPYRRALLQRLGLPFEVDSPGIDETPRDAETPEDLVRRLAREKAFAVVARHENALVIGSDQVADLNGEILGKPGSHARAVTQLERLSGNRVAFKTGLSLVDGRSGRVQTEVVTFDVQFRALGPRLIESYLRREKPYNCAGAFRSEGLGIVLLESMSGEDPNALIGLPLIRLVAMLEAEGVSVF